MGERLERIESRLEKIESMLEGEVRGALRALVSEEARNRRALFAARSDTGYAKAWDDPEPLITVTLATLGRPDMLLERSLPSILGQTYERLEVVVVGDDAGPETERAVASVGDERIRYVDLGPRFEWTDDSRKQWLVGATRPRNAAVRMARGAWIAQSDDDDTLHPECLATLLERARAERAEAVYGRVRIHGRVRKFQVGEFPPALGEFSWAAGMYHAGLRFFERELVAAEFDVPGDWWLAERMLRVGVRFAMAPEVLSEVYPSRRATSE
jgi:glycosyltransferase involved in cell wall biosynthesis